MYVLQPSTDEHGWQYRSTWSNGILSSSDEQWVKSNSFGLDARRRLWITTVVKQEDMVLAKTRLSEGFKTKTRGVIMLGDLYRQEARTLRKVWQRRFVVLTDTKIEIYVNSGGKKIAELSLMDCDIKMLFGVQCPGREYAFSVRDSAGNLVGLFDADNREIRRRWVVAIRYQLALHCAGVNFPPFDYGPPTGDDIATRVLMCGELMKQGSSGAKTWKNRCDTAVILLLLLIRHNIVIRICLSLLLFERRFFQLTPLELQWFDKEVLRGTLPLAEATINDTEKSGSLDFSVNGAKGRKLLVRTDTQGHKNTWIRAIQRQIDAQNAKRRNADAPGEVTDGLDLAAAKTRAPSRSIAPAKREPDPEPEPDLDPEPEPNITESEPEVVNMIRRYSIEAQEEYEAQPVPVDHGWDGEANPEAEASNQAAADAAARQEYEEAVRQTEMEAEPHEPPHPYEEDPNIVVEMFQGLEIAATPRVIDGNVEELTLTAAEPVPEHEEPVHHEDVSPSAKTNSLAERLGRPLAKRTVEIRPDTKVGAEIIKINKKVVRRYL